MRKTLLALLILSAFYSCNKEPQPMSKQEIKQKIDSITKIRIRQSDAQSERDLEDRIKIEVKVKVDSILNAQASGKKDTVTKPQTQSRIPPFNPGNR